MSLLRTVLPDNHCMYSGILCTCIALIFRVSESFCLLCGTAFYCILNSPVLYTGWTVAMHSSSVR